MKCAAFIDISMLSGLIFVNKDLRCWDRNKFNLTKLNDHIDKSISVTLHMQNKAD